MLKDDQKDKFDKLEKQFKELRDENGKLMTINQSVLKTNSIAYYN